MRILLNTYNEIQHMFILPTVIIVPISEISCYRGGYSADGVLKAAITVLYDAMSVEGLLAT